MPHKHMIQFLAIVNLWRYIYRGNIEISDWYCPFHAYPNLDLIHKKFECICNAPQCFQPRAVIIRKNCVWCVLFYLAISIYYKSIHCDHSIFINILSKYLVVLILKVLDFPARIKGDFQWECDLITFQFTECKLSKIFQFLEFSRLIVKCFDG